MNARFYVPYINRFLSADTIVPDPTNPQSLNRYSYSYNNPVKCTDPTGHCAQEDEGCWQWVDKLWQHFGWSIDIDGIIWTSEELIKIWNAGTAIEHWYALNGEGDARGRMRATLGGTEFSRVEKSMAANVWTILRNRNHVVGNVVYLLNKFSINTIIHEIGHVLDNALSNYIYPRGAAVFGGGPGDALARTVGLDPSQCTLRFQCDWDEIASTAGVEQNPRDYGRKRGPSEDFADSFLLSVNGGLTSAPIRDQFMRNLAALQVQVRPEYSGLASAYLRWPIYPVPAPTPSG